jgi:predicted Fe-Mo cluster-binding NifX family protein
MKIAISATGKTLDAEVDPRFGRCQYFIIADIDTDEFEAIDNSSATAAGGAGISAAQMISQKGIEAVLTGNCGPNAHQVFSSAGIKVITGVSGKIKDAIAEYKLGTYSATQQANVPDHYGMGGGGGAGRSAGGGMGRGMGMGRGGGSGGGRGMGRGMGGGIMPFSNPAPKSESTEQEIEALKVQSQALAEQLAGIQQRIEELNSKRDNT